MTSDAEGTRAGTGGTHLAQKDAQSVVPQNVDDPRDAATSGGPAHEEHLMDSSTLHPAEPDFPQVERAPQPRPYEPGQRVRATRQVFSGHHRGYRSSAIREGATGVVCEDDDHGTLFVQLDQVDTRIVLGAHNHTDWEPAPHTIALPAGVELDGVHVNFHGLTADRFDVIAQAFGATVNVLPLDDDRSFRLAEWRENGIRFRAFGPNFRTERAA